MANLGGSDPKWEVKSKQFWTTKHGLVGLLLDTCTCVDLSLGCSSILSPWIAEAKRVAGLIKRSMVRLQP